MNNRLTSDYLSLTDNKFWDSFIGEVKKLQQERIDRLVSVSPENLTRLQGEIFSLGLVLLTPERILRATEEDHKSKEE